MYQWVETFHEAEIDKRAHYSYGKKWLEEPIDSTLFKNVGFENPSVNHWPYFSQEIRATGVNLGKFTLMQSQIDKLGNGE